LALDLFGEPTMGHIFTKTSQPPAAQVSDLYADEMQVDSFH